MIYQLSILIFSIFLIHSCSSHSPEKTIEQTQRKIISYKSYGESDSSNNSIYLELPDSCKSGLKHIKVRLTHGAGCTSMWNFILCISTDNNVYGLIMNDFRFLESGFNSMNDTIIEKDVYLKSYRFNSILDSNSISYLELMQKINSSKRIGISATMDGMALIEDPLSSSSLRHSNSIEIIYE